MDIAAIEEQRNKILQAMGAIRSLRPGTVTEQFLKVPHKGKKEPVERGPYFLWQYYEQGKPVRRRLTSDAEVERARREVDNARRFGELCRQFEQLTRQLGELERERATSVEAVKKKPKSPRKPRRK